MTIRQQDASSDLPFLRAKGSEVTETDGSLLDSASEAVEAVFIKAALPKPYRDPLVRGLTLPPCCYSQARCLVSPAGGNVKALSSNVCQY